MIQLYAIYKRQLGKISKNRKINAMQTNKMGPRMTILISDKMDLKTKMLLQ